MTELKNFLTVLFKFGTVTITIDDASVPATQRNFPTFKCSYIPLNQERNYLYLEDPNFNVDGGIQVNTIESEPANRFKQELGNTQSNHLRPRHQSGSQVFDSNALKNGFYSLNITNDALRNLHLFDNALNELRDFNLPAVAKALDEERQNITIEHCKARTKADYRINLKKVANLQNKEHIQTLFTSLHRRSGRPTNSVLVASGLFDCIQTYLEENGLAKLPLGEASANIPQPKSNGLRPSGVTLFKAPQPIERPAGDKGCRTLCGV